MEWPQILDTLEGFGASEWVAWSQGAALVLGAMLVVLLIEGRLFSRAGKRSSWARMRAMGLVTTPVTVASVLVPSLSVEGPAALAVLYVTLLCVAPVLWFASHLWLGPRLRPALSRIESLGLALSGIVLWAIPVLALGISGAGLRQAARAQALTARSDASIVHVVGAVRRFDVPGAGIVLTQSLIAPPGISLRAVESRVVGPWYPTAGVAHQAFCIRGSDLHLMWSAQEEPPQLRLHTVDDLGRLTRSVFVPGENADSGEPIEPFTVAFRADGFDPVVPIPRSRVFLGFLRPDGQTASGAPLQEQHGDTPGDDCIVRGYQRHAAIGEGSLDTVNLLFYLNGRPPLIGEIRRPSVLR